jgi:predicted RND superfamily exporter protein
MFTIVARLILRNRIAWLIAVVVASGFMAYQGQFVQVSFKFSRLLPKTDSVQINYDVFRQRFNQVGNTMVVATDSFNVFEAKHYSLWQGLQQDLKNIEGIQGVLSPINALTLQRNDSLEKLEYAPILESGEDPKLDQAEKTFNSLPFYQGRLVSADGQVPLMLVQLKPTMLYDSNLVRIVKAVNIQVEETEAQSGRDFKISGLPQVRVANTEKMSREIFLLVGLALVVTSLILLVFLRSFTAMFISIVVVILGGCWAFGLISLFGYEISLLSSLVPTLVIVIGVPNCIFLINKYHSEYKGHGQRILALQRVIRKIGAATFMTNATTAMGFASLILTDSVILKEFGIIASINIMVVFLISLVLIPIYYSFRKPPKIRHYQHLDQRWVKGFINFIIHSTMYNRKYIYAGLVALLVVAAVGIQKVYVTGNLTEEFKENDPVLKDLQFFERKLKGIMPLEIVIDTRRKGGVYKSSTLKRMNRLQDSLETLPELSKSLSLVQGLKFAKQAYYRGDSSFYALPTSQERNFMQSYLPKNALTNSSLLSSMVDSTGRYARISLQVKDLGKNQSTQLKDNLYRHLHHAFPPERYQTTVTGAWMVFQKGATYLIKNLLLSLSIAVGVIAIVMAIIFRSFAMVLVSLIPNLFPLLFTAGLMGYFGIPLKPSTILVFSVAFGISVDDTIHFLAKYRQELKQTRYNIGQSVIRALRETGVSMFYTSIVLFFGFSVFTASSFGGIIALGLLVSLTLIIAMIGNLLLLPTLLLSFERLIVSKSFTENYISIYEEGEDDDQEQAVIQDD